MCGITLEEFRLPTPHQCLCRSVRCKRYSFLRSDDGLVGDRSSIAGPPACMLNLHLYKFGASGWDVLFHFPGATLPTKAQQRTLPGVSHGVWPSSS